MKTQYSVSSPPYKVWGKFFHKKALHVGTNCYGEIYAGMFYTGTNDQIMHGGRLMVKRFQRSSQVSFPLLILTWVIDILFEKLTPQIGDLIWKIPSANYASGI